MESGFHVLEDAEHVQAFTDRMLSNGAKSATEALYNEKQMSDRSEAGQLRDTFAHSCTVDRSLLA